MSKRVFITGAAGFIGFSVSRRLLSEGFSIVGIDNLNDYYDVSLKNSRRTLLQENKNFRFYKTDLSDKSDLDDVMLRASLNSSDIIIHLAAQAGVRQARKNPDAYINSNILGFFNLIENARKAEVEHFIFASSSSIYGGNTKLPFSVHDNVDHPISLYAATKKSNELIAHVYSYSFNLPTTGLRFFTVYGPWGRPDMAYYSFTKAILAGNPISVFNNGDMFRDFTYIDDIVEGVVKLIDHKPAPNPAWDGDAPDPASSWVPYRIYNIGNHQSVKLTDLIKTIEEALGKKALIDYKPMQTGDVKATFADIKDLADAVGFAPKTSIEEGIPRFVDWYKEYYKIGQ